MAYSESIRALSRMTPALSGTLGLGLIGLVGMLDYVTGHMFSCSLFYLLPILMVTWTVGNRAGFLLSIAGAGVWLWVDLTGAERYPHPWLPYWNALVRLGFFSITILLMAVFKAERTLSRTDPLTGLSNRHSFFEKSELEGERCRRYGHPLTMVYVDCDDFKQVNDRHGHHSGDELLSAVAGVFRSQIRRADVAARLGGDEFGLLLPETGLLASQAFLHKLRARLMEAAQRGGWTTTFSIGGITFAEPPEKVDEMIGKADAVMYSIKKEGKNGVRLVAAERSGAGIVEVSAVRG
ncbi:MAG TPA: GGDEF domain-containing protein [Nitrospirales bacterium]|nr:GGDEF domain-containing protein [Nitrospirales bacterium]